MAKPRLIIFESVKWAWKTSVISRLSKELWSNVLCLLEDETFEPLRHVTDKWTDIQYYKNLLLKLKNNSDWKIIFLDRFHFTKWPITNFNPKYFIEIEEILIEFFDVHLLLFYINPELIFERLNHTCEYRKWGWWKMNYDWVGIEEEAEKDIEWQQSFIDKVLPNTLIPYTIIDTTNLHKGDVENNVWKIVDSIIEIINI